MFVLFVLVATIWYFYKKFNHQIHSGVSFMEAQLFDGPQIEQKEQKEQKIENVE